MPFHVKGIFLKGKRGRIVLEIIYVGPSGNSVVLQVFEASPDESISDWFEEAIVALFEQSYIEVKILRDFLLKT